MKYSYCFFISCATFLMLSCLNPKPRKPKQYRSVNYFYKDIIKQNKRLNVQEEAFLKRLIKNDSSNTYYNTSFGVWYKYDTKLSQGKKPKTEAVVQIAYSITSIDGVLLYDKQTRTIKLDKEDFIPAFHDGIKLMRKGETLTFVIPSYRAFGVTGDGHKIKGNQPIISKITLLNFKDSTNEKN